MSALHRCIRHVVMLAGLCLTVPTLALAQTAKTEPASARSAADPAMLMEPRSDPLPAMREGSASAGAQTASSKPASEHHGSRDPAGPPASMPAGGMTGMAGMSGMDAAPSAQPMPGMDHQAMPDARGDGMPAMSHDDRPAHPSSPMPGMSAMSGRAGMTIGAMQGGAAPPGARSPDYSDGVAASSMPGMHMGGNDALAMLLIDQLEVFAGRGPHGQSWDAQAWYGNDSNKLWLRTEGDRHDGRVGDADAELLWNHAVAAYWDTQLGLRHDFGDASGRDWVAIGVQGLAPYWFDLAATAYIGPAERTAVRLRAGYEVLFSQRLILQPELEINAYGKSDRARRIGRGLSDGSLGLRLRYEIRRQFAPYVGVMWKRTFGATAAFARDYRQPVLDRQWVAGFRLWF